MAALQHQDIIYHKMKQQNIFLLNLRYIKRQIFPHMCMNVVHNNNNNNNNNFIGITSHEVTAHSARKKVKNTRYGDNKPLGR